MPCFPKRSFSLVITLLGVALSPALAQGPPLNGSAEQLFKAGINALSGSAGGRNHFAALEYFRRPAEKGYGPAQVALG